ncbi:hypothetical protein DES53_102990 [Roseimicrobium gellanilyticum]|uniref:Uncharacterized protein n=1 Tax=Roseimicrobium gellanilyticum TaxID=748857 RepID=A0A366HU38_9BACT|nr:hypothetical protein DES53_102990 [Roseimicrobium gellanilyticum]
MWGAGGRVFEAEEAEMRRGELIPTGVCCAGRAGRKTRRTLSGQETCLPGWQRATFLPLAALRLNQVASPARSPQSRPFYTSPRCVSASSATRGTTPSEPQTHPVANILSILCVLCPCASLRLTGIVPTARHLLPPHPFCALCVLLQLFLPCTCHVSPAIVWRNLPAPPTYVLASGTPFAHHHFPGADDWGSREILP